MDAERPMCEAHVILTARLDRLRARAEAPKSGYVRLEKPAL